MTPVDLEALFAISRYAGRDVLLAQGGGGNTSLKPAPGRMWIKASGMRLADLRPGHGVLETDLDALLRLVRDPALAAKPRAEAHAESVRRVQAAVLGPNPLRPSLETTFHAVLGPLVLHTHPVYVNGFTCLDGGQAAAAFGASVAWVPYVPPGLALGLAVDRATRDFAESHGRPPEVLALANHGLIVTTGSAEEAIRLTETNVNLAKAYFGSLPAEALDEATPVPQLAEWAEGLSRAIAQRFGTEAGVAVRPARRTALQRAALDPEAIASPGMLVPDDVVYAGRRVLAAQPRQTPAEVCEAAAGAWREARRLAVAVPGMGFVLAGPSAAFLDAMEENLLAHLLVRQLIARRGRPAFLPQAEVDYLLDMDSEKYRQAVAAN